eukprot:EG_transcript_1997
MTERYPEVNTSHVFAFVPDDWSGVCDPRFEAWLRAGLDLFITTGLSQHTCALRLAAAYPNTMFIGAAGPPSGPSNYASLVARLYQATYLAGYTAGLMTKTKKVCLIAYTYSPPLVLNVWGMSLGARAADPSVQVHIFVLMGSVSSAMGVWFVNQSAALGCDVVWLQNTVVDAITQADALGLMSIGQFSDSRKTIGDSVITSVLLNMAPAFGRIADAILNGTFRQLVQRPDWWTGWEWNTMALADFSILVPPAVRAQVLAQVPALDRIFCGRICTRAKCFCNATTCCLTDPQLRVLDAFPDFTLDHGVVQLPGRACQVGQLATWQLETFTMECSDCPAGTYAYNADQISECRPCPAATYSPPGSTTCTACPVGTFNAQLGQGQCTLCPAGGIAPSPGSLQCIVCPSGVSSGDRTQCATPSLVWLYGLGGALVGVFLLVGLFLPWYVRHRGKRNNRAAPKDPAQPFCIVFTDIQSSTALWAAIPDVMARALDVHHTLLRRLLARHDCYEVKTIGDSFMCATPCPAQALRFALAVQEELARHDWGTDRINRVYREIAPLTEAAADGCWNGLRVRAGIHYGHGNIKLDPVSQGYDYYGTVVNTAARVESVCHGGQTGVSEAAFLALAGHCGGVVWTDLGMQLLRGLAEPIRLYQALPDGVLAQRRFPPLRIDHKDAKEEALAEAETHALPLPSPAGRYRPSVVPTTGSDGHGPNTQWADTHPLVASGCISSEDLRRQYTILQVGLTTVLTPLARAVKLELLRELCANLHVPNHGVDGPQLPRTLHGLIHRTLPATVLGTMRRPSTGSTALTTTTASRSTSLSLPLG